jgi:hypothetical protein
MSEPAFRSVWGAYPLLSPEIAARRKADQNRPGFPSLARLHRRWLPASRAKIPDWQGD